MKNNCFGGLIVGLLLMLLIVSVSQVSAETEPNQQIVVDTAGRETYTKIGFALMKETIGFLAVGMSAEDVLTQLGMPEEKSDAQIWGADGLEHQRWYYPIKGVELGMIKKEGRQVVDRIVIKDSCDYKTQRGIKIGSSAMDIHAVYKNAVNHKDSKPGERIVCGTIYGGIIFKLQDDIVSSIFIGAAAE